jgi:hypothetical protein
MAKKSFYTGEVFLYNTVIDVEHMSISVYYFTVFYPESYSQIPRVLSHVCNITSRGAVVLVSSMVQAIHCEDIPSVDLCTCPALPRTLQGSLHTLSTTITNESFDMRFLNGRSPGGVAPAGEFLITSVIFTQRKELPKSATVILRNLLAMFQQGGKEYLSPDTVHWYCSKLPNFC